MNKTGNNSEEGSCSCSCGGCLPLIIFLFVFWSIMFGLRIGDNIYNVDIFPPQIRIINIENTKESMAEPKTEKTEKTEKEW